MLVDARQAENGARVGGPADFKAVNSGGFRGCRNGLMIHQRPPM